MWAVIDNDTVVGMYPPDADKEKMWEESKDFILVEMTPDNSPAWMFGKYVDGKFYPPGDSNG